MNWTQEQTRPQYIPPAMVVMVNQRGRCVEVPETKVKESTAQGLSLAPMGAKAGQYMPIYDQGQTLNTIAPEILEEKAPLARREFRLIEVCQA